jgi:hypothetical protein
MLYGIPTYVGLVVARIYTSVERTKRLVF